MNHMTLILKYEDFIIIEIQVFHENVHMKIIAGTQISRNGSIPWHSKWKRLPTFGVAYYQHSGA